MGCGGLGLAAIAIAAGLGIVNILACDIDGAKLETAGAMATGSLDISRADALDRLREVTGGGPRAVVDTVGAQNTSSIGIGSLVKGGRYVIVGLFGGALELSLPSLPLRAVSILGFYTGSLAELRELIALVKTGVIPQIPVTACLLAEVDSALADLREGRVVGRVVLTA